MPANQIISQHSVQQFSKLLEVYFDFDSDQWKEDTNTIALWMNRFYEDIRSSRRGYAANQGVLKTPVLEDQLRQFGLSKGLKPKPETTPTLCLSHDVDNLYPTWIFWLKQLISQRRFLFRLKKTSYLPDILSLLEFEKEFLPDGEGATVFVCAAQSKPGLFRKLYQFLIDPSYHVHDKEFLELLEILRSQNCEVGIHGSILSLEDPSSFSSEKKMLEKYLRQSVSLSRQHWLNLPDAENNFVQLAKAGIRADSTLGWNGEVGFRCGLARPYPILLTSGEIMWQMPLLLMDRPLFDGMRLSEQEVFDVSISYLEEVFKRNGCVAINWHEAAGHDDFGWRKPYEQILLWAKAKGFIISNIGSALRTSVPQLIPLKNENRHHTS